MSIHIRLGGTKYSHSDTEFDIELWKDDMWLATWKPTEDMAKAMAGNPNIMNSMLEYAFRAGQIFRSAELELLLRPGETNSVN